MKETDQKQLERCNIRTTSSSPERFPDATTHPSCWRLCLHFVACLVSLILGFRFSREALLVVVAFRQNPAIFIAERLSSNLTSFSDNQRGFKFPSVPAKAPVSLGEQNYDAKQIAPPVKSSRVLVGRHEILIRPWPHPDPVEVLAAHAMMETVQQEQRRLYASKEWRHLIVVTPTFSRTFQWPYLTALMHTLRLVPGPLTWIIVEAGRITNQTATLLSQSGLKFFHLNTDKRIPTTWSQRRSMESLLRIEALRFVRKEKLDGIIVFVDDSNTHSLQFFDEVQNVKWIGALSVGMLASFLSVKYPLEFQNSTRQDGQTVSVQGPACNESCHIIGWHLLPTFQGSTNKGPISTKDLDWAGFVLNSRLLWEDATDKPEFVLDWNKWLSSSKEIVSNPLGIVKDQAFVEPLGNCGREVLLWWLRVEARADSKFPSRWVIDPSLEVTVPSKRTPWLDAHSQNLSFVHNAGLSHPEKQTIKHSGTMLRPKQGDRYNSKRSQGLPGRVENSGVSQG